MSEEYESNSDVLSEVHRSEESDVEQGKSSLESSLVTNPHIPDMVAFQECNVENKILEYEKQIQEFQTMKTRTEKEQQLGFMGTMAYQIFLNSPKEERQDWLLKARDHFVKANSMDPTDSNYVEMLCMVLINLLDLENDLEKKLSYGAEFKTFIDIGLKDFDNFWDSEWQLLTAKFLYKVNTMSPEETAAAAAANIELPTESLDEAIERLILASLSDCQEIETQLLIGKCYLAQGKQESGRRWLNKAVCHESLNAKEADLILEARDLLK